MLEQNIAKNKGCPKPWLDFP